MNNQNQAAVGNPLESEPIGKLMRRFAGPAVVSSMVSALYNIIDQIFIGRSIGPPGNAATNVAFPLVMLMAALSMTFGVGGASNFSLCLGKGEKEKAGKTAGNSLVLMIGSGVLLAAITLLFLKPLMEAFGARDRVLVLAMEYTGMTAFGVPFATLSSGGSQLVRADGSPRYAMLSSLAGVAVNTVLDPVFIFGMGLGMKGAALATVLGQAVSGILLLFYFRNCKTVRLTRSDFKPAGWCAKAILALGSSSGVNQLAVAGMQIVMNNTLGYYGELSVYGRDIPLACVGIVTKVNVIFSSVIMGISQSCQPIFGFNYGAGNFKRVKETFKKAAAAVTAVSVLAFLCFQLFPHQIIGIFGRGGSLYYEFATRYLRIYMFCIFMGGIQILTANLFPSIGKGTIGVWVSLSRQMLFLLPLILILPLFSGIDGVLFAGPLADGAAGILAVILAAREMKQWNKEIRA